MNTAPTSIRRLRIATRPTPSITATRPRGPGCLGFALTNALVAVALSSGQTRNIALPLKYPVEIHWESLRRGRWNSPTQRSRWRKDGRLRLARTLHTTLHSTWKFSPAVLDENTGRAPNTPETVAGPQPKTLKDWERLFLTLRRESGHDGGWKVFQSMHRRGLLRLIAPPEAELLRDGMLAAALSSVDRTALLIEAAHLLYIDDGVLWPDLYLKIMYHSLGHGRYWEAIRWHLQLARLFSPGTEVFGALISSFAHDPSPEMQSTLESLYMLGPGRCLYDFIIPALFSSGQSKLARRWRRKLTYFDDFPKTVESRPFLRFLASYFPATPLTQGELLGAGLDDPLQWHEDEVNQPSAVLHGASTGQYSDTIVAKWLASTWTSAEFAISLAHQMGLRTIGPRSLQALALRESDAQGVASHIAQLERLGIEVTSQTYCKVLVFFAKHGDDDLLAELLDCDVHPDEFDNLEMRHQLLTASIRGNDSKKIKLWKGVEWALKTESSSQQLNAELRVKLSHFEMRDVKPLLDEMEMLGLNVTQDNVTPLLKRLFGGLSQHPSEWARRRQYWNVAEQAQFNLAISFTRRVATHDVAIPLRYWKLIILNLGRLGRFEELEQTCLEVVQHYLSTSDGLVPVHRLDWPQKQAENQKAVRRPKNPFFATERLARSLSNPGVKGREGSGVQATAGRPNERGYIPTDLPFSHRQHPLQKLFDPYLQRSIVRWGFDQTLVDEPISSSLLDMPPAGARQFDVACGVRLMALLRDHGVLIEREVVRTTVMTRIAVGQVPGRPRNRSRDSNEMELKNLKTLVDEAWGSELLPDPQEMVDELEQRKSKLLHRYSRLFCKASIR